MKADPLNTDFGVVLLDIEGTTTPVSFVYDVLFAYAREHAKSYLEEHISSPAVQADLEGLRRQHAVDSSEGLGPPALTGSSAEARIESLVAYIHWLMDRDRKLTPLKSRAGRLS